MLNTKHSVTQKYKYTTLTSETFGKQSSGHRFSLSFEYARQYSSLASIGTALNKTVVSGILINQLLSLTVRKNCSSNPVPAHTLYLYVQLTLVQIRGVLRTNDTILGTTKSNSCRTSANSNPY